MAIEHWLHGAGGQEKDKTRTRRGQDEDKRRTRGAQEEDNTVNVS